MLSVPCVHLAMLVININFVGMLHVHKSTVQWLANMYKTMMHIMLIIWSQHC